MPPSDRLKADKKRPLLPEALFRSCDPDQFSFETTDELSTGTRAVGQKRAVEAIRFSIGIDHEGFNLFALGPPGTGRRAVVHQFLDAEAASRPVPPDWCYVNNFEDAQKPDVLRLPTGRGARLRDDMERFIEDLQTALPAAFESEEYQVRREVAQEEIQEQQEEELKALQQQAREQDIALIRTPNGFTFAPVREGEVLSPEQLQTLDQEEHEKIEKEIEGFQDELQKILRQVPQRQRRVREKLRDLNREVADFAVSDLITALREAYGDLPAVDRYLEAVRKDVVENVDQFLKRHRQGSDGDSERDGLRGTDAGSIFRRYRVNLVVDHRDDEGAPVIYEDNPTYANLIGEIEQVAQMGTLVTDFNLIKAGALQQANGGYLIIEARKLVAQPYAWEGLKRALLAEEVRIESPGQAFGLISTVTLEPEAIPLDVKVILIGDQQLYYLFSAHDPDFPELFKVMADFDDRTDRSDETQQEYAAMIAHIAQTEGLKPLDRGAVAHVIERAARLAGDAERLSTHLRSITDLLREADHWAGESEAEVIQAKHVQRAIEAQVFRAERIRVRSHEAILRDTVFISTEGRRVGQINGLSVLQLGDFAFGRPTRITARIHLGKGDVVDIEREVALGGPLHSKGVLILAGFLNGRYAQHHPLSLSASLVFEQSYGGVDGDSASSAELYALLSAIAGIPIRQSLAVTGSVNQHGDVQPIGGVNEKIEGFFDVCVARDLTGEQGVVIPAANTKHLMLREDVVEAVRSERFHVYPVANVDEGLELLTGVRAGERDEGGRFPEGSLNHQVEQQLTEFARRRREYLHANGREASAPS